MATVSPRSAARDLALDREVRGTPVHESCRLRLRPTSPSLAIAIAAGRRADPTLRKRLGWAAADLRARVDAVTGRLVRGCPSWIVPHDHHELCPLDRPRGDLLALAGRGRSTLPVAQALVRRDELIELVSAHAGASVRRFGLQIVHVIRSSPDFEGIALVRAAIPEKSAPLERVDEWQRVIAHLNGGGNPDGSFVRSRGPGLVREATRDYEDVLVLETIGHPEALEECATDLVAAIQELEAAVVRNPQPRRQPRAASTNDSERRRIDRFLTAMTVDLDVERVASPTNRAAARREFGSTGDPGFEFAPLAIDVDVLRAQLFALPLDALSESWADRALAARVDEIDLELEAIAAVGSPYFLAIQERLHGRPRPAHVTAARLELSATEPPPASPGKSTITASAIRAVFAELGDSAVRTVKGLLVPRCRGRSLELPTGFKLSAEAWLQFLAGTWPLLMAAKNGAEQALDLCSVGLPGWSGAREGVALFWQSHFGLLTERRRRDAALLTIGADALCEGAGFAEVHERFVDWGESKRHAYALAERLFRGGGWLAEAAGFGMLLDLESASETVDAAALASACIAPAWLEDRTLKVPAGVVSHLDQVIRSAPGDVRGPIESQKTSLRQ